MKFVNRLWLPLAAGVVVSSACGDASHMFSGVWKAESNLDLGWLEGSPELAIGHYGPELTGIVRYVDDAGVPIDNRCACAYLDQQDIDLKAASFVATSAPPCGQGFLIWDLTLNEDGADPRLIGEVRLRDQDTSEGVVVSFRLDDRFVSDDRRECP